jgi:hypothetical protein
MAIRQVISRTIKDDTITTADINSTVQIGGGAYQGDNNNGAIQGSTNDIFRVHGSQLDTSVTIAADNNALAAGPLTVSASGTIELRVLGNLTIV